MSEEYNNKNKQETDLDKDENKKKKNFFKTFLKALLILILAGGVIIGGVVISILKDAPEIDPTNINSSLDQTSFILSPEGELIEKIQAEEYRTVVKLDKMPKHLQDAFIAIEDERFENHIGIDPRGIISSAVDNIRAGRIVRGASTITQQLVKNVYLTREKSWERKIKEAYLALKVERVLTKDQILELYLNRIFLGQNAYGVQEAAQTYFSKDVDELTIAESALIAGIAKSSANFAPYESIRPENFNPDKHDEIMHYDFMGEKFVAVFNPKSIDRQKLVLKQMKSLGKITQSEYEEALNEDIRSNLKPGDKSQSDISSYFSDYLKKQVIEFLVEKLNYTEEGARNELYTGGLKIYSTIDMELQKELEGIYNNFTNVILNSTSGYRAPVLVNWKRDSSKNIIDNNNKIVYFSRSNLLTDENNLKLNSNEYELNNQGLVIKSQKLKPYKSHIDIVDFYEIDDRKNLVTFPVGAISIDENQYHINSNNELVIRNDFLEKNKNFYQVNASNQLLISNDFFTVAKSGIVQPQSATVVLDYRNGHIKALVGGRDVEGYRILNRATDSQRQPGSVMKPIGTYLAALDNGFTAATAIDDIPFYTGGKLWPRNWYRDGYRGFMPLRKAVEQSANVPPVKVLNKIGIKTSMKYLEKMGIINPNNPKKDSFITASENPRNNDENLSSLALGGMTKGLTPLEVTAAFGAIANDGNYIKPMTFFKIEDKDGNILVEDTKEVTEVVSAQKAYIMKDILNTTVTQGIARRAQIPNMATAGKTGTTQNQADIWFVGFSPYYATGVWIGSDSPAITISKGSGSAAQLWKNIMVKMHKGLESKPTFDRPDGIVTASVCRDSGLKPSSLCSSDPRGSRVYTEIFAEGTVPSKTCDVHVSQTIDSASGLLATDYCPSSNVVNRVFIKRTPSYNPSNHGGIVPTDYIYSVPGSYCNLHGPGSVSEEDEELLDEDGNPIEKDDEEQENNVSNDGNKNENNKNKEEQKNSNGAVEFPLDSPSN